MKPQEPDASPEAAVAVEHPAVETVLTQAPSIGRLSHERSFDGLPARDLNRLPSVRCEAGWVGDYWLQAASIAGRSHRLNRAPSSGQDVYGYAHADAPGALTVLAVADGLGSRPRSHVGATLAVRVVCDEFLKLGPEIAALDDDGLRELAGRVNDRLLSAAGGGWREVGTTLLACGVTRRNGDLEMVALRIGDPQAYVLSGVPPDLRPVWDGDSDEGALNVVSECIPKEGRELRVDVVRSTLPDATSGVALLSDGVANDIAAPEIAAWCLSRWTVPLDPFGMADTLRYERQGSLDDRTALVLLMSGPRDHEPADHVDDDASGAPVPSGNDTAHPVAVGTVDVPARATEAPPEPPSPPPRRVRPEPSIEPNGGGERASLLVDVWLWRVTLGAVAILAIALAATSLVTWL